MFRTLDLFSGIGGFSLGLERTGGFRTVAFCEIDPFCRRVLAKHWPDVPQYDDIRTLTAERLAADGIGVDAICGGFPCQDISTAGKGAGLAGERSGLWREYARLVGEIRPRYVVVENVAALLGRGIGRVLGDLAALGFDAEWHCIPASAVGAPHQRDRVWIVAHPSVGGNGRDGLRAAREGQSDFSVQAVADPARERCGEARQHRERHSEWVAGCGDVLAHTDGQGLPLAGAKSPGAHRQFGWRVPAPDRWWATEPAVGRVAHGVPARVDRLRALGNAVVPQIPEMIGRAILSAEGVSP